MGYFERYNKWGYHQVFYQAVFFIAFITGPGLKFYVFSNCYVFYNIFSVWHPLHIFWFPMAESYLAPTKHIWLFM